MRRAAIEAGLFVLPLVLVAEGGCTERTKDTQVEAVRPAATAPPPPAPSCDETLGLGAEDCAVVRRMRLPAALPPARGNAHSESPDAAYLGFQLFFRSDLGHGVACATCHDPSFAFTDRKPVSTGASVGTRNAPTTLNAARLRTMFWDGRADSLWSQPLFAIEDPREMSSSRLELAHYLDRDADLRPYYERAFGPLPSIDALSPTGKPGEASFDELPAATQDTINRVAANVGKSFEAYLRKNTSGDAPLDRYLDGDASAIVDDAKRGLGVFVRRGCVSCHAGPMFTDEAFHVVSFPLTEGGAPDPGALVGVRVLEENIFNLSGPYADPGPASEPIDRSGAVDGAFRTPSLRMAPETAPYGHNGVFPTLGELLAFHARDATTEERAQLIVFLRSLRGELPPRPWSFWPSPQ